LCMIENSLHIPAPCPIAMMRMKKDGNNYFCSSCKKNVIDMREKPLVEIRNQCGPNTCVILNADQLGAQPRFNSYRKFLFSTFAVLSLLGFTVKPVKAQVKEIEKPAQQNTINSGTEKHPSILVRESEKYRDGQKRSDKKKKRKRKKPSKVFIGCPSF